MSAELDKSPSSPTDRERRAVWLGGAGLVVAAFAAYSNTFSAPFVFDDRMAILENATIRHLWPLSDVLLPPSDGSGVGGRPLVNLSLALNYAVGGEAVAGYHVVNLLLHAVAALGLFGVVRRTLRRRPRFAADATRLGFLTALLWTLHPLQTESVTCVIQRTELLAGCFYLLTIYGVVRSAEVGATAAWRWIAVAACLLGMTSKEIMVTAPVVALLFDRAFLAESWREVWNRRRPLHTGLMATWVALALLVWKMGGSRGEAAGFGLGITGWSYALKQCEAVMHYLRLTLWPVPLVLDYGTEVVAGLSAVWPQALALGALGAAVIYVWQRRPAAGFAGAAFFIVLAPSSSVVPLVAQTMAEHRMYVPLACIVAATVTGLHWWLGRRSGWVWVALALGLGGIAVQRNGVYRSAIGLWRDTIANGRANPRAHLCLAMELLRAGQADEAEREFQATLQLNPWEPTAHNNFGQLLANRGRLDEARAHFEMALKVKPRQAEIHTNLSDTLRQLGRLDEALDHGKEAVRLRPDFAEAQCNLGLALVAVGRAGEGMAHYREALRLKPDFVEVENDLAIALMDAGELGEAGERLEKILRVKPDFADAHNARGVLLVRLGRRAEAVAEMETALRLKPNYPQARQNLQVLRAEQNQPGSRP